MGTTGQVLLHSWFPAPRPCLRKVQDDAVVQVTPVKAVRSIMPPKHKVKLELCVSAVEGPLPTIRDATLSFVPDFLGC